MNQQQDDVASSARRARGRIWIAAAVEAVVVVFSAGIAIAVTESSTSNPHRPQPATSPKRITRAGAVPPYESFVLDALNKLGEARWQTIGINNTPGPCYGYLFGALSTRICSFTPIRPSRSQVLYVRIEGNVFNSPAYAYESSGFAHDRSASRVPGVGDEAGADSANDAVSLPGQAPRPIRLSGVSIEFVYRQALFFVHFYGADYHVTPDGTVTNVRGFSFERALGEAKAISLQIIAKLPLT